MTSKNTAQVLKLAKKFGPMFKAPVTTLMAITEIESGHDPKRINMSASAKGGAWGLGQQMADEAEYKVDIIRHHYAKKFPQIKPVLAKWKGDPKNLLDPELNMLLTSWQIGRLSRIFNDLPVVAAAYHQGENAIKRRIESGQPPVSEQQPKGLAYVVKVETASNKYAPVQLAFAD